MNVNLLMSTLIQLIERAFLTGESEIAIFEVLRDGVCVDFSWDMHAHNNIDVKKNVIDMEGNSMEEYLIEY